LIDRSRGASYLPLEIYRILMARALAHKRTTGQKSRKAVRPVKKTKAKAASRITHGKTVKAKAITGKAKLRNVAAGKKATSLANQHSIQKESMKMEAESRKQSLRTEASPALNASPRLLRQTKTTSAALAILEKGIGLIFQKEFKKARNELKTLLETYPGELDILARARSYIQICEREEAAQKKQSISTDQLYTLGVLEHNKANYDMAISYFLQSLENHPAADYIYYSVAASMAMKGNLAESMEHLRKAVELNEDSRVYAKNDADFTALQSKKEFAELVGINQPPSSEL
jgi:tetratricopeptide (TPR) repeat protein